MKTALSVFDYKDYKNYLLEVFPHKGEMRGKRNQLAKVLNCQTSFISQVLNHKTHLSLEHAVVVCDFLEMSATEKQFFILLVEYGKAGSVPLRQHFEQNINEILNNRQFLLRAESKNFKLKPDDLQKYYRSWTYAAVHMLMTIPHYANAQACAEYLKIPQYEVSNCIDFLVQAHLLIRTGSQYTPTHVQMHLQDYAELVRLNHVNWRLKAISALEFAAKENMHYSSIVTLALKDLPKIKKILARAIEEVQEVIKPSPEEILVSVNLDCFRV